MRRSAFPAAALGLIAVAAMAKLPTLSQPLTENFAWRQTQTAWTARIYHQQGIDLLRPEVPVHGPPWIFGFEFPLFQAFGAVLMDVGLPPDVAMRGLGLATFSLTGGLLWALTRRLVGEVAALLALAAFLFSPFGLLWGRTSLIEYLATAAALGFLLIATRWLDGRRPVDFVLAMVLGTLAMLVKITTGAFYLVPLLAYRPNGRRLHWQDWPLIPLLAVPAVIGRLWIAHTDALKAATPATAFQTSDAMTNFNFGTLGMRVDPTILAPILAAIVVGLSGAALPLWVAMGYADVRRIPQRWFVAALAISVIVLAPLVLTPLYSTQNYYPAAISPVVAMVVGTGAAWAWAHRRAQWPRVWLAGGVALWILALVLTRALWLMSYEPVVDRDGSLAAAAFVRERTDPGDWVIIDGRGWDPTILYYAERRGYMLDDRRSPADDLERLLADPRYALAVSCPYESECRVLDE